jgi:ribosomal protein L16/L10AE
MGPKNVKQVQEKLRAVAHALRIADEKLPAPRG